ncbi:phosphoadenosine phosphosulfate reductase family protein (plasmid) [Methanocaldococcus sp. 16A]
MDEKWREYFLIWAESEVFQEKLKKTKEIIKEALSKFKKPYIAFSGGKDSTALMHLVLSFDDSIMVLHWDYGPYYLPRPLEKEIIEIAKKCRAKNLRVETSKKYWILKRNAVNVLGVDYLGKLVPQLVKEGYDLAFVGLRAEEAVKRRLRTQEIYEYDKYKKITNVYPLRDWSWKDVWAYIVSNNLPYLSYYDKYCPILGWDKTRFVTLFDLEFDKFGSSNIDNVLMWRFRNVK